MLKIARSLRVGSLALALALTLSLCGAACALCESEVPDAPEGAAFGSFRAYSLYGEPVTHEIFSSASLTMVNVWGTYCGPCIMEMPDLGELGREYADRGLRIVGIVADVYDDLPDSLEAAIEIVEGTGADYLHILPSAEMIDARLRYVRFIPETFFLDSSGRQIGESYVGSRDRDAWIAILEPLLAEFGG